LNLQPDITSITAIAAASAQESYGVEIRPPGVAPARGLRAPTYRPGTLVFIAHTIAGARLPVPEGLRACHEAKELVAR
jgi:hypothetical protein